MAPRTREQQAVDKIREENDSLKSQLALLGGLVVGAIHSRNTDSLDQMVDCIPYLQTLPSFVAMRQKREKPIRPFSPEPHPNAKAEGTA